MDNDKPPWGPSHEKVERKHKFLKNALSSGAAWIFSVWLVAMLGLAIWLFGSSDSIEGKPSKQNQRSLPEVVQLSLGKTRLYIPSKYLKGRKVGKNHLGQAVHIGLWALLPDFDWYEPSRNHFEFVEQLGQGRRIQISLDAREGGLPLNKFFKEHPSYQKYTYFLDGQYDELKYGLEFYNNHHPRSEWYWLRDKRGEPILRGTCRKDEVSVSPGCELMWELSSDVRVRVDFNKGYLPEWKLIYSQVNRLLSPFPRFGVVSGLNNKGK
ncbi:hypothetical protein [Motiliproteus sp. MSK22-1]|uniref:hypothetical protein n=1 Tax=Motiliproteus sp. MSK22-1 TaxID=1897630 RepID=UPI0009785EB3|nr:hypothetical protein [Motiliproteus sp. MSK22-1]OMH37546.1 hypothetical protein BGP75_09220 [Motiliproteus sp. MSK22-1]